MIKVDGLCDISVSMSCDSISESGTRLSTYLVDYPRIVHAEQLKHRVFSTSAASSRAIPFAKMVEQLKGRPVRFGSAKAGMQDGGAHNNLIFGRTIPGQLITTEKLDLAVFLHSAEEAWEEAKKDAVFWSKAFVDAGYHKQTYNRITEPYQMMRVLVTTTEIANWFWLRNDKDADPTIHELARCMQEVHEKSVPQLLKAGEWHLPFIQCNRDHLTGIMEYSVAEPYDTNLTLEEAIKVSAARSAAQSFRNTDYGLEKSLKVYDRLVNGDKIHSGALEHQATPMPFDVVLETNGVTCLHKQLGYMSGNFSGWLQHRQFIKDNTHYE